MRDLWTVILVLLVLLFGAIVLGRENCPCNQLCEIEFADGTSERILCRYADIDGNALVISTKRGRLCMSLSAIKSYRITRDKGGEE